jgi:hypothetical protein
MVVSAGTGHGKVDELLQRSGVERNVQLTVPHYVSVGHILQGSDLHCHRARTAGRSAAGTLRAGTSCPTR